MTARSSRRPASTRTLAAGVTAALLLTACGAEVVPTGDRTRTVTVPRCGEQVAYTTPRRAVVYEGGSADKLFALGLTDHVHGYVLPPANPPVTGSPWAAEYAKVRFLSDDLLNKELVVDARADLVVAGWNSGFSDGRGITPELLDGLGIQSFVHTESCFNYPGFPERVTPFEGLYADLDRLGRIFGFPSGPGNWSGATGSGSRRCGRRPRRSGCRSSSTTPAPTSRSPPGGRCHRPTSSRSPGAGTSSPTWTPGGPR